MPFIWMLDHKSNGGRNSFRRRRIEWQFYLYLFSFTFSFRLLLLLSFYYRYVWKRIRNWIASIFASVDDASSTTPDNLFAFQQLHLSNASPSFHRAHIARIERHFRTKNATKKSMKKVWLGGFSSFFHDGCVLVAFITFCRIKFKYQVNNRAPHISWRFPFQQGLFA